MSAPLSLQPDPRLAWLHRAHAKLILVENGMLTPEEAFDDLLLWLSCSCTREMVWRWEIQDRRRRP
jgi:hypothetical protein